MITSSTADQIFQGLLKLNLLNLIEHPIPGDYSLEHLDAIHQGVVRNFYLFNLEAQPIRSQVKEGYLFQRDISIPLGDKDAKLTFVHSMMSAEDLESMKAELYELKVSEFKRLKRVDFVKRLCESFIKLYYYYPYRDFALPTLITFYRQFAAECGYSTVLSMLYEQSIRNAFHISTMLAVNRMGIKLLDKENAEVLQAHMDCFDSASPFEELFLSFTDPFTAIAFNNLAAEAAHDSQGSMEGFIMAYEERIPSVLKAYPELESMIKSFLKSAKATMLSGASPQAQEDTINKLVQQCIEQLRNGEGLDPMSLLMGRLKNRFQA